MAEDTYQEVIDKLKVEEGEKDEVKEVPEQIEKCEAIVEEEKEGNETTDAELEANL